MRTALFLLVTMTVACAQRPELRSPMAEAIRSAMAEVRKGNLGPAAKLKVTPADAPVLAEYLRDQNTDIQREAVVLLETLGGEVACPRLVQGLTSGSEDVREQTARVIHRICPPPIVSRMPNLETALRRSVELGNPAAAAVLLLGRFPDAANREFLGKLLSNSGRTKLESWSAPVPTGVAAAVAGVSAGTPGALSRLVEGLKDLAEAEFIASVLEDISVPGSLQSLLALFDNRQSIRGGVPSGAQPRRLCDLAVESFTARLSLNPSFQLNPGGKYTPEQVAEVKDLAAAALRR